MGIPSSLQGTKTIAVVCNQWGDTGKGKLVDYLAENWADIIIRGTGGANAGHTIVNQGKEYILHLVPSGILQDRKGKTNIIGEGVVLDPAELIRELSQLERAGLTHENLRISHRAKLVLPTHILLDRAKESKKGDGRIGTTGRGIGPAYEDHVSRRGMTVNDMMNPFQFAKKFSKLVTSTRHQLNAMEVDSKIIKEIMQHPHLGNGTFYDEKKVFNEDEIVWNYTQEYAAKLKPLVMDTEKWVRENVGKKNILLEGAQGLLLSIDYGTKPFVTSSDPSIQGLAKGAGLSTKDVDVTIGIVKAYMTRVGGGPFPTEMGGKESETHCEDYSNNKENEKEKFKEAHVNHSNALLQGIGFRIAGGEYGATTKRPRRTGWLDLVTLRHAMNVNGKNLFLTKVDVLDACEKINVCTGYTYEGQDYFYAGKTLTKGDTLNEFPDDSTVLEHATPQYETLDGWKTNTTQARKKEELPTQLIEMVRFIETKTSGKVLGLCNGPEREQIIFF